MVNLVPCSDPFSLAALAARIRKSSNFHFAWQFLQCGKAAPDSPAAVRRALDMIIATPLLHQFLRESFTTASYNSVFAIAPLHKHCVIWPAQDGFENVLARAAGDHLGAYSRDLRDATDEEKRQIKTLFESVGNYETYELWPGDVAGCEVCDEHQNHIFSTWFHGIAWDWCLFAVWPDRELLWMGCLTDTD